MTEQSLEVEAVLGVVALNPASKQLSDSEEAQGVRDSLLDGIASPAGASSDSTVCVDLGVLVEHVFPALLHVNERLRAPVHADRVGQLCVMP